MRLLGNWSVVGKQEVDIPPGRVVVQLPSGRSLWLHLTIEHSAAASKSSNISGMELQALFSEDPAFVLRRADDMAMTGRGLDYW